jgi:HEAT repeat protein
MSTEETVFRLVHQLRIAADKEEVLQQLVAIGEPAVEPLLVLLQDDTRAGYAAIVLGRLRDARAIAPLLAKMQEDGGARFGICAIAIGQIGDPSAVEPLLAILANTDQLVEQQIENLNEKAIASGRPKFLMRIGRFLGRRYLREMHTAIRENSQRHFRCTAITALGLIGDPRSLEPISAYADASDERVRKSAQKALTRLKTA